jgi:NADPH:quinone reductase-like Zn-dependent oxidoreductase
MPHVVRFHEYGGPEVLRIEEVELREPGPGEVRIRVRALGLNRAEAMIRRNSYIERAPLPSGLGLEAAGIVDALGEGVADLAVGDAVSIVPPLSMVRWPAYGEIAIFPAELAVKHPPSLSWEGAAATWMQYVTAYGALIDLARLAQGDYVVITAASSSVGLAAIRIARMVGAIPIAVTRSSKKKAALVDAGAAHVIVSSEEDLSARFSEIAGPAGIRVVFDCIGGPAFEPLVGAMARGGILVEYGALSPEPTPFPLFDVLSKSLTLRGFLIHEIVADPVRLAAAKTFILDGLGSGALQPIIARVFPFAAIVDAHHFLESNEQFGKIVVTIP